MIDKIDHIGIAVRSLKEMIPFYRDVLGLRFVGEEEVPEQRVRVAMFQVGEVRIELLEPTDPTSPITRFLEKKGPGLHHVAFGTKSIENALEKIQEQGVELIDEKPRPGAHNTSIAFLHPASTGKVLLELCQPGDE